MVKNGILERREKTYGVDSKVFIKADILRVDEGMEEIGTHILIFHRGTVLIEEFTNQFAIGTIYLGGLTGLWVQDTGEIAGRLTKEPKEVDIDSSQIEKESNY